MSDIYDMHPFTLNTSGGYDANGSKQAATTSTVTGLIERKRHLVIDSKGEQVVSSANIWIDYNSTITLEDSVTFDSKNWIITAISHPKDFTFQKTHIFLR